VKLKNQTNRRNANDDGMMNLKFFKLFSKTIIVEFYILYCMLSSNRDKISKTIFYKLLPIVI